MSGSKMSKSAFPDPLVRLLMVCAHAGGAGGSYTRSWHPGTLGAVLGSGVLSWFMTLAGLVDRIDENPLASYAATLRQCGGLSQSACWGCILLRWLSMEHPKSAGLGSQGSRTVQPAR